MGHRRRTSPPSIVSKIPPFTRRISLQNEPYRFTHLVFVTRVYRLSAEEAAELHSATPRTKRNKGISAPQGGGVFSFHPEDEQIQKVSTLILFGKEIAV